MLFLFVYSFIVNANTQTNVKVHLENVVLRVPTRKNSKDFLLRGLLS